MSDYVEKRVNFFLFVLIFSSSLSMYAAADVAREIAQDIVSNLPGFTTDELARLIKPGTHFRNEGKKLVLVIDSLKKKALL